MSSKLFRLSALFLNTYFVASFFLLPHVTRAVSSLPRTTPSLERSKPMQTISPSIHKWRIVPSPSPGSANGLNAVAAVSANDVWAVGYDNNNGALQTLIEQWNGSQWNIISSPSPGANGNFLQGVAAISASDVWAVGVYYNASNVSQTLIEQWNGASWNIVPSPSPGIGSSLSAVSAISANNIWAVGSYTNTSGINQTLTEEWNGTSWSFTSGLNVGPSNNQLYGVTALSANNIWAVGSYQKSNGPQTPNKTLIEQWNGSVWRIVSSPNPAVNSQLYAVAAVSANNVLAVGYSQKSIGPGLPSQTLIEQWNGSTWVVAPSPNKGADGCFLNAVAVVSATDVWVVGGFQSFNLIIHTLTEQWNGSAWSIVPSPNQGKNNSNGLNGVVALSDTDAWAVGFYNYYAGTLIENYS